VQEARDEAALGVVDVDTERLDLADLVRRLLEPGEVRRLGERGVRVDGMGFLRGMGEECGGHFGGFNCQVFAITFAFALEKALEKL
jgi:hypothetical protein